jgi:hypothetical protein
LLGPSFKPFPFAGFSPAFGLVLVGADRQNAVLGVRGRCCSLTKLGDHLKELLARLKTFHLGVIPRNKRLRRVIRGIGNAAQEVLHFLHLRNHLVKGKQLVVNLLVMQDMSVK